MSGPAVVLSTILNNPALPQISASALSYLPEFELNASDHWLFDKGDASGLVGRVNGLPLTPNAPETGVKSVVMSNRGSYTVRPSVSFTGGGGTGAAGVVVLGVDGGLDVYVTQPGQGYTSPPTPVFTGGTGSGAVATAVLDGRPTYAGAYLSTQPGGVNGLKTQWDDAQVSTMCAVVQRKAITTAGRIVMGTGSETADGGEVVYWAGTNHQFRVRNGGSNTGITGTIADDQWYFVAKVSNNGDHIAMVGGQTPVTQTQAKVLAARKYALGNVYYKGDTTATAFYQGLNAAEFIFYNGVAKTAAELAAIYARTKIRMARRGLTLF